MTFKAKTEAEFWEQVERGPGCWPWKGATDEDGYGRLSFRGRRVSAHRLAWELTNGPIPAGLLIRHLVCDNPPCCRPDHEAVGSNADNMADKVQRERQARGERNGRAKLSEEDAREIVRLHAAGATQRALARRFEIHSTTIQRLLRGQRWAHLDDKTDRLRSRPVIHEPQQIAAILELRRAGESGRAIARRLDLAPSTVRYFLAQQLVAS